MFPPRKCLLMTIAEEAPPRLDDFDPQHMSILAWGYATLEYLRKKSKAKDHNWQMNFILPYFLKSANIYFNIFQWCLAPEAEADLVRLSLKAIESTYKNHLSCQNAESEISSCISKFCLNFAIWTPVINWMILLVLAMAEVSQPPSLDGAVSSGGAEDGHFQRAAHGEYDLGDGHLSP